MSPVGITPLMLAAFAGFAWLAWRKLAIVMRLQPEVRWDQPATRLKAVLVNGFLPQRMVVRDWKPGLMHTVIFLGFVALLLRKLKPIAIGHDEPFVDPGLAVAPRSERVIFHDPCTLGRSNGEYEAPRRIIRRLTQDEPLAFEPQREKATCCGAGGARMGLEESIGTRIDVARAEQAPARQPKVIATACPHCAVMIGDGLKTLGGDAEVMNKDIAELVAEALLPSPA